MLNKKIAATNMTAMNSSNRSGNNFKTGSKFSMNEQIWTVVEEFVCDNTPMRKISSVNGEVEIIMLKTLQKDAKFSKNFKAVEE